MVKSAYIHIPFCKSKCKYCSFISFTEHSKTNECIESLLYDINYNYSGETLDTIYFGGGTPSLLSPFCIKKIIDKFKISSNCEITFEMNPDDVKIEYLNALFEIGINRISLGAQTFDDNVLKLIGRRHNSKQIFDSVELLKKVGFSNLSLDLIYGLPNVNIEQDLNIITDLGVQHISTYGLKIEENSFWGKFLPENLPNEDEQADMYLMVNEYLEKKGYKRYEISNFAIDGYESKHNLNYWNNNEYYGFGLAAHGYINDCRYSNTEILNKYIVNPRTSKKSLTLTPQEQLEEEIFLGFRKAEGINVNEIQKKFDILFNVKYKNVLDKYMPDYIEQTPAGYKLTIKGVLLSNLILSEFIE